MSNPEISVGVRAEAGQLAPGMQQAANAVEQATQQMRQSFEATRAQTQANMTRMRDSVKAANDDMVKSFASLVNVRGVVVGAIGAIVAAVAGGAMFRASIKETIEMTEQAERLGHQLGITATEAAALAQALGDLQIPTDQFEAAAKGLINQLRANSDELEAMGLKTRDAAGHSRAFKDILFDAIRIVGGYKEGIDRNLAAHAMFGRGVNDVSKLIKLNNEAVQEATEKQKALQAVVGVESKKAMEDYKAAMNDVGDVMSAVRKSIAGALMPVLTDLGNWFASAGPTTVQVFKGSISGIVTVMRTVGLVASSLATIVKEAFESMGVALATYAKAAWQAVTLDFKGAGETLAAGFGTVRDRARATLDGIIADAKDYRSRIVALWSDETPIAPTPPEGKEYDPAGNKGNGGAKHESMMPAFEAILTQRKLAWDRINELDGTFYEFGKAREAAFWKDILDHERLSQEDRQRAEAKYLAARLEMRKEEFGQLIVGLRAQDDAAQQNFGRKVDLARRELALIRERYGQQSKEAIAAQARLDQIERQAAEQRDQLKAMAISSAESEALAELKIAEEAARRDVDLGRMSKEDLLALEAEFEARRYEIRRQAAEQARALVDPDRDPVEYARRSEQLLELERQYRQRRAELLRAKMTEESQPLMLAGRAFEASWNASLQGLLQRTMSWGDAVRNVFVGTVSAIVMEIGKIPAKWIVGLIAQKAVDIKAVLNNAIVAASGAYASTAAIPIVGPALAPGAASLAYANVAAMAGGLAVARRGYDIPAGVNPLVQAHEREMILPAEIAEPVREMVATGGGQRRGGGDTFVIQALDSRSFEHALRRNGVALARGVRDAVRDGR